MARIPWEAMGEEAGSWLDPLFQGPAPISGLQGLGERYVQLRFLGEGAAGTVFKAFDTLLQRWVALKALKEGAGHALTEARAQAQVEHPNVCRVYEVGRGFIVMQLVEGTTLATLGPRLDLRAKVACLRDIALGVHAAHQRGLLHLDLKLNNVLVQDNREGTFTPLLSDFGMVMSRFGETPEICPMGTPPFSSPEQLAGDSARIGPATDVYAMGVMAYVLFSDHAPFEAASLADLLVAMVQAEPIPLERRVPGLPRDLARLVHQCLHKAPAQRCADALELALEFDRFLERKPLRVMGRALPYRALLCARRNRFTTRAILVGVVALGVLLTTAAWREVRTAQRTEWDRHFQKRVEEARVILERAYRRPAHDLRPELAQVRAIEEEIRRELTQHGRLVEGPAHLALGQLAFASEAKATEAAQHFKAAWDAGLRTEGARTWLAFTLLREYREALVSTNRPDNQGTMLSTEALGQRYLEPARQMLQGRGDTDQARLKHMVDQVELQLSPRSSGAPLDLGKLVALAVAYRRQAPQDLDALLEEIDARVFQLQSELMEETPRILPADLKAQWKTLLALLEAARSTAPSHPGIQARVADAIESALEFPGLDPTPKRELRARNKACLEGALRIAPDDPRLLAQWLAALAREALDDGLPLDHLQADFRRVFAKPAIARTEVLFQVLAYLLRGGLHGRDLLPLVLEAMKAQQTFADSPDAWVYVQLLCRYAAEQGQDPEHVIQAAGPRFDPDAHGGPLISRAEYLVQAGRPGEVALDRLDAASAREFRATQRPFMASLRAVHLKARVRGSRADWYHLEQAFAEAPELARAKDFQLLAGDTWINCGLSLAEHAHASGQDPAPYLNRVALAVRELPLTNQVARLRTEVLNGRIALARSVAGLETVSGLRRGIVHLDTAMGYFGGRIPFRDFLLAGLSAPGRGPSLCTRGELWLRLAGKLRGSARRAAARCSSRDLERALELCPGYRARLDPLRREARRLANS